MYLDQVFGGDFPTADGTGIRDYIHVVDLVKGHVAAVQKILSGQLEGLRIYNLGASKGYSVLEVVHTFEKVTNKKIPYKVTERRQGDVASLYADASLAAKELEWTVERDLTKMCQDTWKWQQNNPMGYADAKIQTEDAVKSKRKLAAGS